MRGKRLKTTAHTAKPIAGGASPAMVKSAVKSSKKPMLKIPRMIVNSELLNSAGYDAQARILEAEYSDGGIYRYFNVPKKAYNGIFKAKSVGNYFMREIRPHYECVCIHRAEYKETKEYKKFVRENLKFDYIEDEVYLAQAIKKLKASKKPIAIDFECAIESYSDKTRGALRLVQLGIETPRGERKGRQWIVDCFRVDPTPLIELFESEEIEKYIHFLFFEEDWATSRFGHSINHIYDTCIAWRGIQAYLSNGLRAAAHLAGDKGNLPRTIRREFGCTLTNRQYFDGLEEGTWDDLVLDEDSQHLSLAAVAAAREAAEADGTIDKERKADPYIRAIENDMMRNKLPEVPELLKKAGYQTLSLQSKQVLPRLLNAFESERSDFPESDDDAVAKALVSAACEVWTVALPTPRIIEEGMPAEEKEKLERENEKTIEAREKLLSQRKRTPFILPKVDAYGYPERGQFYECVDFDPNKRSSTSFHPNTLAYVTKAQLGFEIPKTEQAGYWGRPELTHKQLTYAAVDVAVLGPIVRATRKITDDLGISDRIQKGRITASEHRVIERVKEKLERDGYQDHRATGAQALRRARSLEELDGSWDSLRQLGLVHTSYDYLRALYEECRASLGGPASTAPKSETLLRDPF